MARQTMMATTAVVDNDDKNLPFIVGKRNDGCNKTKTEEEETVADSVAIHNNQTDHREGGW